MRNSSNTPRKHKIFIDADVLIGSSNREEHMLLRNMAVKGQIELLFNPEVRYEQQQRSLNHYYGEYAGAVTNNATTDDEIIQVIDKQDTLRSAEEQEIAFWKPAHIKRISCTFSALIRMVAYVPGIVDTKNELAKYEELVTYYKIKKTDAVHVMTAHRGECDYFLTWDNDLIKKCKKVPWLKIKVLTPHEYLQI